METFWIVESQSGTRRLQVYPSDNGTAGHRLSGGQSGTVTFLLGDDGLDWTDLTLPWANTIVRCWNDVPKFAGLIKEAAFSDDDQTLTVSMVDVETFISDCRYPFGASSYWADEPNHIPGQLTITSKSLRAAIGKVIEQGTIGPSAIYSLPIVLPSLSEGGTFTNTYYNYHFQTVGDIMADFRSLGLEIELEPRWQAGTGKLEYLLRAGTDAAPKLSGGLFEFNQTVPKRRLTKVKYTVDGTMQLTGQFGVGEGMEVDMRVGGDGIGGVSTIPARDAVEYYKTEPDEARLAAYGTAAVAARQNPTIQWEMALLSDELPGFENIRLGSVLRMFWEGNRKIPDGTHDVRVIGWSAGSDKSIVIDAQTVA